MYKIWKAEEKQQQVAFMLRRWVQGPGPVLLMHVIAPLLAARGHGQQPASQLLQLLCPGSVFTFVRMSASKSLSLLKLGALRD